MSPRSSRRRPSAGGPPIADLLQQALAFHQAGRGAEAARLYEAVLARDSAQPAANHLLGLVHLQAGRPDEAARLIRKALEKNAGDPQYWCNLGVALNAAGRPAEALDALDRAIRLRPDFAPAHSNRGMALKTMGRLHEAAESYRRALELKPGEAGFHFNLGNVLTDEGDWEGAVAAYRQALAIRPGYATASFGLAAALGFLGRPEEAEAATREGLARSPEDAPLHQRLGRTLYQQHRLAEAVASFRQAIALAPAYGEAHHQLALTLHRTGRPDAEIDAMEALFADPGLPPDDRVYVGFGLGKALADVGEHARSVEVFEAANAAKWSQLGFDPSGLLAAYESDIRPFDPDPGEPVGALGEGIVFVVGLPRSGKSTVEALLGQHPAVHPAGELKGFERFAARHLEVGPEGIRRESLTPQALSAIGEDYLALARAVAPAGKVVVDTMPVNFRHLGLIRLALPRARVLLAMREPVGQRIALYEKLFNRDNYEFTYQPAALMAVHRAYLRLVAGWRRVLPFYALEVDVSTFEGDREPAARRLLEFCGLGWDPAVLRKAPTSEPQLGGIDSDSLRSSAAAHLEAWRSARPEFFEPGD